MTNLLPAGKASVTGKVVVVLAWVCMAVLAAGTAPVLGEGRDSIPTVTYQVEGLSGPAEILIDPWGIPHIYASAHYDAFFVQGWNAARDRLFQIDLWRRRGLGLLSEVLGPAYVEQDRASRLLLYRGDMYWEWLAYGSDAKRITIAFVNGINSYVRMVRENPELLPWEFKFLGYEPAYWEPDDVVRIRSHGLRRNASSEISRAQRLKELPPDHPAINTALYPPWQLQVPEGLDVHLIPPDALAVVSLGAGGVDFSRDKLAGVVEAVGSAPDDPEVLARLEQLDALYAQQMAEEQIDLGSNNWVVSPRLTATGRPILANDPHRAQSVPSLRYIAHLVAPGLNVIGAGEPALPGISIGHNGTIAFGLTIWAADQEDVYVYETNPENPNEYKYMGRWEPMEVVRELVPVRGGDPVEIEMKFTRHGPVVYEDPEKNLAIGFRAAWLEPGMAPYFGSVEYMRAQNWDEFLAAMNRWGAPSENQVYADIYGNIGWKPGGLVPIRPNWDGLLPVPGDGRYEWAGFYDQDLLPVLFNPERGWLATANEMRLFDEFEKGWEAYPYRDMKISFEWSSRWRAERLRDYFTDVARRGEKVTIAEMARLQSDHVRQEAKFYITGIDHITSQDPKVQAALELLRRWDMIRRHDPTPEQSAAEAFFNVWSQELGRALIARAYPPDVAAVMGAGSTDLRVSLFSEPEKWFATADPVATWDEAVHESLARAVAIMEERFGDGPWKVTINNPIVLRHPLSALVDEAARAKIDLGPERHPGWSDTVGAPGASWRMVLDVGNWDNSLALSNPGQSGDPDSPYYRNLWPRWLRGEMFPLLYSRERIEAVAEHRIVLEPAGN